MNNSASVPSEHRRGPSGATTSLSLDLKRCTDFEQSQRLNILQESGDSSQPARLDAGWDVSSPNIGRQGDVALAIKPADMLQVIFVLGELMLAHDFRLGDKTNKT